MNIGGESHRPSDPSVSTSASSRRQTFQHSPSTSPHSLEIPSKVKRGGFRLFYKSHKNEVILQVTSSVGGPPRSIKIVDMNTPVKTVLKTLRETCTEEASFKNPVLIMTRTETNDDILLDGEQTLAAYDVATNQHFLWTDRSMVRNDEHRYLKVLSPDRVSYLLRFPREMTQISDLFRVCVERIPDLNRPDIRYYGLFHEVEDFLTYLRPETLLEEHSILELDVLEINKAPLYEFEYLLTAEEEADPPKTILLEETTTIRQLLRTIVDTRVTETKRNDEFGLIHVPLSGTTNLEFEDEDEMLLNLKMKVFDLIVVYPGSDTVQSTTVQSMPTIKLHVKMTPDTIPSIEDMQKLDIANKLELEDGEEMVTSLPFVSYHNPKFSPKVWQGQFAITNVSQLSSSRFQRDFQFRIIFISDWDDDPYMKAFFHVPLLTVAKVEKIGRKKVGQVYALSLTCRDFRTMVFDFDRRSSSRRKMFALLDQLCFPQGRENTPYFANTHFSSLKNRLRDETINGWSLYDVKREFERMFGPDENYEFSSTYPRTLVLPAGFPDEKLKSVGNFRSKARIPALTYSHVNGATICRASQPLVGLKRTRCPEDEQLLHAIRAASGGDIEYHIYDARPLKNAIANIAGGGGYENLETYSKTTIEFLNIGNIHVMRDAVNKISNMVQRPEPGPYWLSELESSHWLDHIQLILDGALHIVDDIEKKTSVLVHCSDGWDRTAQLSGVAQVCLDSYYRSIIGLGVLIEKEFLSFGHMFQERIGHGDRNSEAQSRSPIFLQFIDSLYQLSCQFPTSFEWNENTLIAILDSLYSCQFGTWLCNNERERTMMKTRTVSLWSHMLKNVEKFKNPFFVQSTGVIRPSTSILDINFWKGYYCRWQRKAVFTGANRDKIVNDMIEEKKTLEEKVKALEKQLALLNQ
ncbi:myotubularin-related protein 2 [Planoprotostelium fungivorum]|uniref:Myotubularin-related protein 2 n=1 Tax=Planoprotostelium fungivorum TaxID=1890364 RepID=A0A2P6N383_9EUKA|nr:myotubularin-related protein 2 [Planoprotostelium fungivorum]